jgi:hypothetical protein
MMVWQCKAKNVTSVLSGYTRTKSIRTLGIATISKTVNVLSFNKMYFIELHVYSVKSANSIQECNIGVYMQRNTIVFCPLTNCSTQTTQINKAGFLATNSHHTKQLRFIHATQFWFTIVTELRFNYATQLCWTAAAQLLTQLRLTATRIGQYSVSVRTENCMNFILDKRQYIVQSKNS